MGWNQINVQYKTQKDIAKVYTWLLVYISMSCLGLSYLWFYVYGYFIPFWTPEVRILSALKLYLPSSSYTSTPFTVDCISWLKLTPTQSTGTLHRHLQPHNRLKTDGVLFDSDPYVMINTSSIWRH